MIDWAPRVPNHASSGSSERFWPFRGCHGPGDRYPNRQLKTKSGHVWLFVRAQPHSLHSLKRFFWRRSIVINHLGGKAASPALPSAPPCTEAPRSRPRPKALGFRDRSVNTVERRHRAKSVLTHYKAGIPPRVLFAHRKPPSNPVAFRGQSSTSSVLWSPESTNYPDTRVQISSDNTILDGLSPYVSVSGRLCSHLKPGSPG